MQKIPLIWNITQACPWNCSFCCINAHYLPLSSESLETELEEIKRKKVELPLEDKLKIVDNLDIEAFDIDISGGEPLLFRENVEIIKKLSSSVKKPLERVQYRKHLILNKEQDFM